MSIDPRTIKQLLQLQMSKNMNLNANSKTDANSTELSFADLLETLLSQNKTGKDNIQPGSMMQVNKSLFSTGIANQLPISLSSPSTYDSLIQQESNKYGVASNLVKAVIDAESSFDPDAVSHSGAKGLMQLMDTTGQGLGVRDPFDPEQNIAGGTQYLGYLLNKYPGQEGVALAAYNAGYGRIDKLGITNDIELQAKFTQLPKETQQYVQKVLSLKHKYGSISGE